MLCIIINRGAGTVCNWIRSSGFSVDTGGLPRVAALRCTSWQSPRGRWWHGCIITAAFCCSLGGEIVILVLVVEVIVWIVVVVLVVMVVA